MLSPEGRDRLTLGPWRRRRRMARLLAELDRADEDRPARRTRGGDWGYRVRTTLLVGVLVLVLGGFVLDKLVGLDVSADGIRIAAPLGRAPDVGPGGSYAFLQTQRGSDEPVAYDPCRPLELVVNDRLAPEGAGALLRDAAEEIAEATGLRIEIVGTTDEEPGRDRAGPFARRIPALVAWTTPEAVPDLEGRVAGIGGSTAVADDLTGRRYYVTGMVALDAPQLTRVMNENAGESQVRAIVMHELGHLVGLDHVDDPAELMNGKNIGRMMLGDGDRAGLALLGRGDCF